MCYAHTRGPAGIPFELASLAEWLVGRGVAEAETLRLLAEATQLSLPDSVEMLWHEALPPEALAREVQRGRAQAVRPLLAGVELVELAGVTADEALCTP